MKQVLWYSSLLHCPAPAPTAAWFWEALSSLLFIPFVLCHNFIIKLLGWEGRCWETRAGKKKKARQNHFSKTFLGKNFLWLRKEKPDSVIKHFSRERKNKFSRVKKQKNIKTKAPNGNHGSTAGKMQLTEEKHFLYFSKKAAFERPAMSGWASAHIYTWLGADLHLSLLLFQAHTEGVVLWWQK